MEDDTMDSLTRRRFLERLGLALAAVPLGAATARAADAPRRRLLVFTKSSGFEHSVIKRGADGSLSLVERVLTEMGAKHGFDVTCTKDGSVFDTSAVRDNDAF